MTTHERTPTELRNAYYELSMSEGLPDPEMLDALIRLYPQFAKELTSFAIDLTVDRLTQDDAAASVDPAPVMGNAASSAVSAYHNALIISGRTLRPPCSRHGRFCDHREPFQKLDRDGMRAAARALGANSTL